MPVLKTVGMVLGAMALIGQGYDTCVRAYSPLRVMRRFGQDFQLYWRALESYWTMLGMLMERDAAHLQEPPDPRDPDHRVTKIILEELEKITAQFQQCELLIVATLRHSEVDLAPLMPDDLSAHTSTAQASSASWVSNLQGGESTSARTSNNDQPSQRQPVTQNKSRSRIWKRLSGKITARLSRSSESIFHTQTLQAAPGRQLTTEEMKSVLRALSVQHAPGALSEDGVQQTQAFFSSWIHVNCPHNIKNGFEQSILRVQRSMNILSSTLALRTLESPQNLLSSSSDKSLLYTQDGPMNDLLLRIVTESKMLDDVHTMLSSLQKNATGPPTAFSIVVTQDSREVWQNAKGKDLTDEEDGFMLWLQAKSSNMSKQSTFLVVEGISRDVDIAPWTGLPQLELPIAISQLNNLQDVKTEYELFQTSATDGAGRNSGLHLKVSADTKAWNEVQSLASILDDQKALEKLLDRDVVIELYQNLCLAFLKFQNIKPGLSGFGAEGVLYFEPVGSPIDLEASLLHPYFSCGFGRPALTQRPGTFARSSKDPSMILAEFCLLLYEIGNHRRINLGTGTGRALAKYSKNTRLNALSSLYELENRYGSRIADVVSACLQANTRNLQEVLWAAVVTLETLKLDLKPELPS